MKIDDLARMLGKTRREVEDILSKQEVIELNLTERNARESKDDLGINLLE